MIATTYDIKTSKTAVSLNTIPKGTRVVILEVPEGKGKSQLIRLGILKGEFIRCMERLPGGTIVIEKNRREIALGAHLAKQIIVAYTEMNRHEKKSIFP